MLDLDAERNERMEAARAARGEEAGPEPVRLGGQVIALLPAELPIDVLEPITRVKVDTALLFRSVMDAYKSRDEAESTAALVDMLVDLVIMNPDLPAELVEAVKEMGRRILGADGYEKFVAARPSLQDGGALIKGLAKKYSMSSGKSSPSSATLSGGTTSTPISATTSESTSTASGGDPVTPVSSEPDGSSPTSSDSPTMPS
ncbi:hypothetical protein ACQP10_38200 (plasmid) [Streptosporangium sandarakinum]|uniref:hypothetical protein n=1 Tax=Streptosporangium sandarakinum TaxID=1260955 RepID=UPI003D8D1511